jgi:hypothetical protein
MQQELADGFEALRRAGAESSALVDAMVEGVLASDERDGSSRRIRPRAACWATTKAR